MKSFKYFQSKTINEEFDVDKAVKDALHWMENKYGKELYTFKHVEGMNMNGSKTKSYDINVGENTYKLNLRKFDSNGDGEMDTVGFDVQPDHNEPEEVEEL